LLGRLGLLGWKAGARGLRQLRPARLAGWLLGWARRGVKGFKEKGKRFWDLGRGSKQ
jgi:hypothetical protein